MMAIAFASNPDLLIADEPTTGLDSPLQVKILNLLDQFKKGELNPLSKNGLDAITKEHSLLIISHDVGIIGRVADRIVVMYSGRVMESASKNILTDTSLALHPYTRKLVEIAAESPDVTHQHPATQNRLTTVKGDVPDLFNLPRGCKFHPRCDKAFEKCLNEEPQLLQCNEENHQVRCWLYNYTASGHKLNI
jgi:peptide/nickel transport system ATP-binding protein